MRPATLMQYVNLKVLFFGAPHISSGLYIITKQQDSISTNGYKTTLTLTRVSEMTQNISEISVKENKKSTGTYL